MLTITIVGLDRIRQRFGQDITPHLSALTLGVAEQVRSEIQSYPAATEANRPHTVYTRGKKYGRTQWYVRGEGPHWLVKGARSTGPGRAGMGRVHEVNNVMGIERFKHTSEQLGQQWHIEAEGDTAHVVVNRASYASYVHSQLHQARFHGDRGWKTDRDAIDAVKGSGMLVSLAAQFVVRWWNG